MQFSDALFQVSLNSCTEFQNILHLLSLLPYVTPGNILKYVIDIKW